MARRRKATAARHRAKVRAAERAREAKATGQPVDGPSTAANARSRTSTAEHSTGAAAARTRAIIGRQGQEILLLLTAVVGAGGFLFLPPWQALALLSGAVLAVAIFQPLSAKVRLAVYVLATALAVSSLGAWVFVGFSDPPPPVTREELAREIERLFIELSNTKPQESHVEQLKTGRLRLAIIAYINSLRAARHADPLSFNPDVSRGAQLKAEYDRDIADGLTPTEPPRILIQPGATGVAAITANGPASWKRLLESVLHPNRRVADPNPGKFVTLLASGVIYRGNAGPPPALLSPRLSEIGVGIAFSKTHRHTWIDLLLAGFKPS
jgi:hypothetical protein